jgi:hypothetical protein
VLHARPTLGSDKALCETDGPEVPDGAVALVLDGAGPDERAEVTCPECRAWMRA